MENKTPMDKVLIGVINLAIKNGVTKNEIYKAFNRYDVSRKSNYNLRIKYHKLIAYNKINKEKLEVNDKINAKKIKMINIYNQ